MSVPQGCVRILRATIDTEQELMNISVCSFNKRLFSTCRGQALLNAEENETSYQHAGVHRPAGTTGKGTRNYK